MWVSVFGTSLTNLNLASNFSKYCAISANLKDFTEKNVNERVYRTLTSKSKKKLIIRDYMNAFHSSVTLYSPHWSMGKLELGVFLTVLELLQNHKFKEFKSLFKIRPKLIDIDKLRVSDVLDFRIRDLEKLWNISYKILQIISDRFYCIGFLQVSFLLTFRKS